MTSSKKTTAVCGDDNIFRFPLQNIDVFDGINILQRCFKAVLDKMCSGDPIKALWVLDKVSYVDKIKEYFTFKYSQLSLSEQEKVSHIPSYIENLTKNKN